MENLTFFDAVNSTWVANGDNSNDRIANTGQNCDNTFILYYITDGNGTITVNDIEFRLSKGQSFLVYPFSLIKIHSDEKNPWSYKWIEFCGAEPTFLLGQTTFTKKNPVVGRIDAPEFHNLFTTYELNSTQLHDIYRIACKLIILLTYYIEYFPRKTEKKDSYAQIARSFIDQNYYKNDFTVKTVADYVKIDRTYLYRLFKEETGQSIIDYINSRKIARAETMLINNRLSVKEVAETVGFNDQMYFSRIFKKFKGMSPTEFRKSYNPLKLF